MPKRERYLWVCTNERPEGHPKGCCNRSGSLLLRNALKVGIVKRGLRTRLRVCESSCLDLCSEGPAFAVMPDNKFYGGMQAEQADAILDAVSDPNGDLSSLSQWEVPESRFDTE